MSGLKQEIEKKLLEKLAELEHEQWNHWMLYQEKKFGHITDMTVDEWYKQQELWQRWITLAHTPYAKLSEKEKKSDREWARKVLKLLLDDCVRIPIKQLEERFDYYEGLMVAYAVGDYSETPEHLIGELKKELLEVQKRRNKP